MVSYGVKAAIFIMQCGVECLFELSHAGGRGPGYHNWYEVITKDKIHFPMQWMFCELKSVYNETEIVAMGMYSF